MCWCGSIQLGWLSFFLYSPEFDMYQRLSVPSWQYVAQKTFQFLSGNYTAMEKDHLRTMLRIETAFALSRARRGLDYRGPLGVYKARL